MMRDGAMENWIVRHRLLIHEEELYQQSTSTTIPKIKSIPG